VLRGRIRHQPGVAISGDRYEPLPGLFGLPAHFLRKLSPRRRQVAVALCVLLLVAGVATAIALGPRISSSKREHAAAERRAQALALEKERARLAAEQRPLRGRLAAGTAPNRAVLIAGVEQAVTRDASTRANAGELEHRARRTECRPLGRDRGRLLLSCTAITREVPASDNSSGVVIGYGYRAAVSPESGRYALCKTSGVPIGGRALVELPAVCSD
jgi:hypothetical protein